MPLAQDIRTIAMDTSSRTSVALTRVLCREASGIDAGVRADGAGSATRCSQRADAALIIGDPALFLDHEAAGVAKIDLGRGMDAR